MNGTADLTWGALAGKTSRFDSATLTCGGTYCHGSSLAADVAGKTSQRKPTWTKVDGSQSACGTSCHTNPPGGSHSASTACESCHKDVISSFVPGNPPTVTWANAGLHINGKVEAADPKCTSCHGDPADGPAPPKSTKGETQPTQAGVGAHAAHLEPAKWHRAGQCSDCHATPTSMSHSNGKVDFTWGGPSVAGSATPSFKSTSLECANTYCHGAKLADQTSPVSRVPVWTDVDGSAKACGTACHANPPAGDHPTSTACEKCHDKVIASFTPGNPPTVTWKDGTLHVNGTVEASSLTCTSCHGTGTNPEPPRGTKGETAESTAAVGAHARHLKGYGWHRVGLCTDCHASTTSMSHANGKIDLAWGGPSAKDGATPAFDATTLKCSSTYCHGTTLAAAVAGGTVNRTPVWNVVNDTWDACGKTCHTNPPGGTHPTSSACQTCHPKVIASFTAGDPPIVTWADSTLHINGSVEATALNCTSCHGTGTNPMPPNGTHGETAETSAAVGAHARHMNGYDWHRAGQCTDCHTSPSSMNHSNGKIDLTWGGPSKTDGATPAFNTTTLTCSGVYCHGATLRPAVSGGQVKRTPVWNVVNESWDACGSTCHTNPPGGDHPNSTACQSCHPKVIASFTPGNPSVVTWADKNLHINGTVESAALNCTSCHGSGTNPMPPNGTHGETAETSAAVGAHARHMNGSGWHRAGVCSDCHSTPTSMAHSNGRVDFSWGGPSNADGASSSFNATTLVCSNTYCHGNTLMGAKSGGTVKRAPVWNVVNNTWDACGSTCHTNPPGGSHPQQSGCQGCHGDVISSLSPLTWKDASKHINGIVERSAAACGSCHATPPNSGEHAKHQRENIGCDSCHPSPNAATHNNGVVNTLRGSSGSCAGNCHGSERW
jgi:predicted CxxxxCH...CXXCH cytochrome family protein